MKAIAQELVCKNKEMASHPFWSYTIIVVMTFGFIAVQARGEEPTGLYQSVTADWRFFSLFWVAAAAMSVEQIVKRKRI